MNRRSFLRNSALALFGFAVLPPAKTYERVWRAEKKLIIPWMQTNIYARCFDEQYLRAVERELENSPNFRCVIEKPLHLKLIDSFFFGATINETFANG